MKKIIYVLIIVLIAIQFIRPEKNIAKGEQPNYIGNKYAMSDEVKTIFKNACNDCHSNTTVYLWYSNFQPVAWWMANHIKEGKEELNFDEFLSYTPKRQKKKIEHIADEVKDGKMPIPPYLITHKNAKLTDADKTAIANWCESTLTAMASDSTQAKEPATSNENNEEHHEHE